MDVPHIKWLLYYRRYLFSVLDLDVRYNWQVLAPKMHHSLFPISHLCILTCITWKLPVIYECCAYQMTALLMETFVVWFRVVWGIWLYSYGPRHASVILSYKLCNSYYTPARAILQAPSRGIIIYFMMKPYLSHTSVIHQRLYMHCFAASSGIWEFHSSNLYHFNFCTFCHYYQVDLCILLVVDSMKVLNQLWKPQCTVSKIKGIYMHSVCLRLDSLWW